MIFSILSTTTYSSFIWHYKLYHQSNDKAT